MQLLTYVTGDATEPTGTGPNIIAHVCNDAGYWGAGFVMAVSRRWRHVRQAYRDWYVTKTPTLCLLGMIQAVSADMDPGSGEATFVVNMIAQHGIRRSNSANVVPLDYDALATCLRHLAKFAIARHATVHMPRIGAGLAGGDWSLILPLIERELCAHGIPVFIYTLPPRD